MAEKADKIHPIDPQEFELPETTFSRDINNKVFHGIIEKVISRISGVSLQGETLLDHVIGRTEKYRGITTIQEPASKSIKVKIELSVKYGTNIPQKAEEVHSAITEELTKMTGLHVSEIHVVFKDLIKDDLPGQLTPPTSFPDVMPTYQDEFENDF